MSGRVDYKIKFLNYIHRINIKKQFRKIKKGIINHKKEVILFSAIVVLILLICLFATNFRKKSDNIMYDIYNGKSFVTETYPIFKDVVFVGDSYSHHIALELGFDTTIYSSPGLSLEDLKYCFESTKKNQKKYTVIFIGPNDFRMNTDLNTFNRLLANYVDMLNDNSKVILCSYLSSLHTDDLIKSGEAKYKVEQYDKEIKKVATSNENSYYFDLSDLDKDPKYFKHSTEGIDRIHFNHDFYIKFINKLYKFIVTIG